MATNTITERFAIKHQLVAVHRCIHLRLAPFLHKALHFKPGEERHFLAFNKEIPVRDKRIFIRHVAAQHHAVHARANLCRIQKQRISIVRNKHFTLVLIVHLVIASDGFWEAFVHNNHAIRFFSYQEVLRVMRHALLRKDLVNSKPVTEIASVHQHAFILETAEDVINLVGRLEAHYAACAVDFSIAVLTAYEINIPARLLHPFGKLFGAPALERTFAKRSMPRG